MADFPRVYRKSAGSRVLALVSLAVLAPLLWDLLRQPAASPVPLVVVGALFVMALMFLVSAFGDRYTVHVDAVEYDNLWLRRCRLPRPRRLALPSVVSVREHRGRTLFLKGADGSRFVIDAVERYVEVRDHILHACAGARRAP